MKFTQLYEQLLLEMPMLEDGHLNASLDRTDEHPDLIDTLKHGGQFRPYKRKFGKYTVYQSRFHLHNELTYYFVDEEQNVVDARVTVRSGSNQTTFIWKRKDGPKGLMADIFDNFLLTIYPYLQSDSLQYSTAKNFWIKLINDRIDQGRPAAYIKTFPEFKKFPITSKEQFKEKIPEIWNSPNILLKVYSLTI